jgi:protein TonB
MMNEKLLRLTVLIITALLHLALLLFFVVHAESSAGPESQNARIMKLTDFNELPPPVVEEEPPPVVEEITEIYIETDIPQAHDIITAPAALTTSVSTSDNYLSMHQLSNPPQFDENAIAASLAYPQMALRSGIEGRVFIELFVDKSGIVQRVAILREEPEGWGFGDAAVKAFAGRKGTPALLNGEPVSARFRYPVTFRPK